MFYTKWFKLCM